MKKETKMGTCASPAVIMVIDDVPANVRLLGEILLSCGYQVQAFTDGAQALTAAAASPPDLVLLDISMPGLDGYMVCERLKADERLARVPVLFISALGETLDKVKAFQVGGVDYITKPFEVDEVLARVDTHLKLRRALGELERKNEELRELEALRDSLVHMIIHDLRNPLAAASSFLYLLQESEGQRLSEKGRGYVQRIARSTASLIEIINSMLDVSRMESGRMELKLEECELGSLVREVLSRLESLKGARQLTFAEPEQPVVVWGDPQLLARLIQNLVGNALKFTP
ncbi:MAG TPA: hybrid sensor histidine kinase/response regulator, partial [Candidatus Methanoperedens sp.]|nr:hybrid sensor histidine kinase/response regulator [Candidatus Methanoperedens sp.]